MRRKYISDYRLENQLTKGGRMTTVPVYRGDWFEFTAPAGEVAKARRRYLALTVAAGVCLLFLLIFTGQRNGQWYVILPAAFSSIFYFFAALSTYRLLTVKGPVTREHKDQLHDRMAPMSMLFGVLGLLCTVGCVYSLIADGTGWLQIAYTIAAAAYTACGAAMFLGRGVLKMEKAASKPKTDPAD